METMPSRRPLNRLAAERAIRQEVPDDRPVVLAGRLAFQEGLQLLVSYMKF